jgi:hypothetical protein
MRLTHYQILGIQNNATEAEIKSAYKKQALIWHPDKARDWAPLNKLAVCESIFNMLKSANNILLDSNTRANYDMQLSLPAEITPVSIDESQIAEDWKKLKSMYEAFKQRETDPQAFITYLQQKMMEQSTQTQQHALQLAEMSGQLQHLPQIIVSAQIKLEAELKAAKQALAANEDRYNKTLARREAEYKLTLDITEGRYNNLLVMFNEQKEKLEQLKSKCGLFATSSAHSSTPTTLITAPTTQLAKFRPQGLNIIYKVVAEYGSQNIFSLVKLSFEKENAMLLFTQSLNTFSKMPGHITNFMTLRDPAAMNVLNLNWMNCQNYYKTFDNFNLSGPLLLEELEKVVDISGISQRFVDYKYHTIEDKDLPDYLKEYLGVNHNLKKA